MTEFDATAIVALFTGGIIGVFLIVFAVAFYLITALGYAQMFKKAGEAGWKGFIPVYNLYMLYKLCWKPNMFFIWLALDFVGVALPQIFADGLIVSLICIVVGIASIVIDAKRCGRIAKAYGRGIGTAVGFFFFPIIFSWILGLGSAEYTAPQAE